MSKIFSENITYEMVISQGNANPAGIFESKYSHNFQCFFDVEISNVDSNLMSKLQVRRRIDVDISTVLYLASKKSQKSVEKSTSKFRLARWEASKVLNQCNALCL